MRRVGFLAVGAVALVIAVCIGYPGQDFPGTGSLRIIRHPDFRLGVDERHFTYRPGSVDVEYVVGNAEACQQVGGKLGVDQAGGGVYPLHEGRAPLWSGQFARRTRTIRSMPSVTMPAGSAGRPEMLTWLASMSVSSPVSTA